MGDNQTSHITVRYSDTGVEFTKIYAVTQDIWRALEQVRTKPAGEELGAWLENQGCKLDCSDGSAHVERSADGVTYYEGYYRAGRLVKGQRSAPFAPPAMTIQGPVPTAPLPTPPTAPGRQP
jgi:hypothetical protein